MQPWRSNEQRDVRAGRKVVDCRESWKYNASGVEFR